MQQHAKRPRIKLPFRARDKYFELFGMLLLLSLWALVLGSYSSLPESIPIRFTKLDGTTSNHNPKGHILVLPILTTVMYLGLTALERIPRHFNYLVDITEENAEKEYRKAVGMMRILKVVIVVMFLVISAGIINEEQLKKEYALIIVLLSLILLSLASMVYLALKK